MVLKVKGALWFWIGALLSRLLLCFYETVQRSVRVTNHPEPGGTGQRWNGDDSSTGISQRQHGVWAENLHYCSPAIRWPFCHPVCGKGNRGSECRQRAERKRWGGLCPPLFVTSTSVAVYFLCYWRVERKWWRGLPLPLFITSTSVAVYFLCYWRVERKWWRDLPLPLFVTSISVAVYFLCFHNGYREVFFLHYLIP